MNITITGHRGYIGTVLHKLLPNATGIDLLEGTDIRDPNLELNCDVLIHLAALVSVGESVKQPYEYYDTNLNGTINLLKKFSGSHFIFASTGSAADSLESPYSISKKAAEEVIEQYCTMHSIPYTIFRFYNVTGGNPTNPDAIFAELLRASRFTKKFTIYGNDYETYDGTPVRDYVHVEEIAQSIVNAINYPSNSIESLGHGVGYSVLDIVNLYKEVNDYDFKVEFGPRRQGDKMISVLDNPSKFMADMYSIAEILKIK